MEQSNMLTQAEQAMRYEGVEFPNLVTRIKAVFIDMLIILIVFSVTSVIIDKFNETPDFVKGFILVFMIYLYDPLMTSLTGSTLGHKAMRMKVRQYKDPQLKISVGKAFLRFIIKSLIGWLSFLTVTGSAQKRAVHDLASGSIILYNKSFE